MDGLGLQSEEGTNLIQVTPVSITDYNASPNSYLKNASNEYQYDVIMFGSWDSNAEKDISPSGAQAAVDFISTGRGVLFGHDTVYKAPTSNAKQNWWQYFHEQFDYLGVGHDTAMEYTTHATYNGMIEMSYWTGSQEVKIINDGYLMKYPFEMENEVVLTIPYSHNIELSNKRVGTIWAEFINPSSSYNRPPYDDANWRGGWYLKTNNNVAMIQTGHSRGQSTEDERKIIANVLYNLAQVSLENTASDYSVLDDQAPDEPTVDIRCGDSDNLNIRVDAEDKGKTYQWYVEADTKDRGLLRSDTVKEEISSNIAGYFYRVTDTPSTPNFKTEVESKKDAFGRIPESEFDLYVAPNDDSTSYLTAASFSINEKQNSEKYVQVIAVDRMSNVSEVKTIQIKDLVQHIDFEIERTADEAKLVELSLSSAMDNKMKAIEIQIPKNTEIKDLASMTLPNTWYSYENSETSDYYSFSFVMQANNSQAVIQTFLESLRFTIKSPQNNSGKIKIILHEEAFTSWIDPNGVTHYYTFVPQVKTWMEAYNQAKSMNYRGLTGYLATLTSEEEHNFVYNNIGKTFGWLGGSRLVKTQPANARINDDEKLSTKISDFSFATNVAPQWYWVNGPEAGTTFFTAPTLSGGGQAPVGVYEGFNRIGGEPSNGNGSGEYCLQFAQGNTGKYWNDISYNRTDHVAGFYVEFSEYGGQTEKVDWVKDNCWNAAIPQKISLKAYNEENIALSNGDLLYDQQLRIGQSITVTPTSLDFYEFLELRELDNTPRGLTYNVSDTYQQGKAIYSLRKAIMHIRQVVVEPSDEIVIPSEGYVEIKNNLYNNGSPAIDPNYQSDTIVTSGKNADNPTFSDFILSTKHLNSTSDQILFEPIVPAFYTYLGHYVTTEAASHQNNTTVTSGAAKLDRSAIDTSKEFWITLYIQPNMDDQDNPVTPQPYSWDYKKNDLGKIKTK